MGKKSRLKRDRNRKDPPWTPFVEAELPPWMLQKHADLKNTMPKQCLLNSRYQVLVYVVKSPIWVPGMDNKPGTELIWISIKRLDKDWMHDWREIQRIKNEVLGPEYEAVELYPAESRMVDSSNQYHLWCLPAGFRWPFGYQERLVVDGKDEVRPGMPRQRPFEETPKDAISDEVANELARLRPTQK